MNLIIDGNNLAHRCRHVFSLSNKGEDVSVKYGFLRVLQSLIRRFKPTSVIVCWDGGTPEFRRLHVPEYKIHRDHGDPVDYADFLRQIDELITYALPMMGVINARRPGAEADDLIYHASRMLVDDCVIVSSDKDLFQAIADGVQVFNPARETLYDAEILKEEIGVDITKYVDWRAIQGDGSDNIPGVPGIGEKTATKLFQQWGSLSSIINAALGVSPKGSIEGKIGDNIRSFGWDRISKNVYVMALYADRVGARRAVLHACDGYSPCSIKMVKRYLLKNTFISLVDSSFLGPISKLVKPKIRTKGLRMPVVPFKRKPVA